jgi:hypothetical protein
VESEFRALLTSDTALTALVPATSIVFGDAAQGVAYPIVSCYVVSGAENMTYAGPDGLLQSRIEVDCYADDYSAVKAISRAVINCLQGYRGGNFGGIFHLTTRDDRSGGGNTPVRPYRTMLDFEVHWRSE